VFLAKGVLRELRAKGRPFGAGPGALMVVGDVGVVLSGVVMLSYPNGSFGPSLLTLYVQWYAGTRVQAGAGRCKRNLRDGFLVQRRCT
jgi:hypothetical protein